jgi:HPt (histidine-containing phosphotransfer) domain-containing protein
MMADRLSIAWGAGRGSMVRSPPRLAFDAAVFDELREMIGYDGVMEMVEIFRTETRRRVRRLAAGGQDRAAVVREMHTLKGAAGTVGAPRLAALGRDLEQSAQLGIVPTPDHRGAIEDALEAFLAEVRSWTENQSAAA